MPDAAQRVRAQQRLLRAARSPAPLGGKSSGSKSSGSLASGRRKGSSKAAGVEGTAAGLRQCVLEASALLGEPFTFCPGSCVGASGGRQLGRAAEVEATCSSKLLMRGFLVGSGLASGVTLLRRMSGLGPFFASSDLSRCVLTDSTFR